MVSSTELFTYSALWDGIKKFQLHVTTTYFSANVELNWWKFMFQYQSQCRVNFTSECLCVLAYILSGNITHIWTTTKFIITVNVSSLHFPQEESMTANELELKSLKESLQDTQPVGVIVNCCHTLDQVLFSLKVVFLFKIFHWLFNWLVKNMKHMKFLWIFSLPGVACLH